MIVNRKHEAWKYTDLSFLAQHEMVAASQVDAAAFRDAVAKRRLPDTLLMVFINGFFVPALSDVNKLPNEIVIGENSNLDFIVPKEHDKHPFVAINYRMATESFVITVLKNYQAIAPLHLLSLTATDVKAVSHQKRMLILEQHAKLSVIEECDDLSTVMHMSNTVTSIHLGKEASLHYQKLQTENTAAVHLATTLLTQQQNSSAKLLYFANGASFAREDLSVSLQESGAHCSASGLYATKHQNQYVDNHIEINHTAAHTESEMLYKGVVDNRAKAVFNGRLYVEAGAQKITAHQANHNLLLADGAEVYSKPELEIYADDVKCKHGATTGQINQDALFYLRARGISQCAAMNLLLQGFMSEIFDRIEHAIFKTRVISQFALQVENSD